ncbi:transcriptional regulator [Dokdonia pacifica]|uniref:AraC-type DNA-binding protein n=1 Tax=Dokdonia pacifica TaxID=1627892 RepID=A0A239BHM6_9FLAO|nr:helix-turn-helix domain-containing protein [Dokdonia pacifica]GGG29620.1 transcriptional regulator [Dokdonia pacifica]SNS06868.1 AraC-type DNA-binding protein [Dokdonia pacifica]
MCFIKIRSFIFWSLLCLYTSSNAQDETQHIPDSLEGKSYKYLNDRFLENRNDTTLVRIYLNTLIAKAIINDDKIAKSHGLIRLSSYAINDEEKLNYIQESIAESNAVDSTYAIPSYNSLGIYYYVRYDYEKALQQYITVLNLSIKKGIKSYEVNALDNIGKIKLDIGKYKEALAIYRKCFYLDQSSDDEKELSILESSLGLSESFRYNKQYDSASYYYEKVIKRVREEYPLRLSKALINEGINLYHKNEKEAAEILLRDGMSHVNFNSQYELKYYTLANYYLGEMIQSSDRKMGENYFLKVDSLVTKYDFSIAEVKGAYTTLIANYKAKDDYKKQSYFQSKLLHFNEVITTRNLTVSNQLNAEFDTPRLLKSRQELIESLKNKNRQLSLEKILLAIVLVLAIGLFLLQYLKNKKYKKRFENIIKEIDITAKQEKDFDKIPNTSKLTIDVQLVKDILNKLDVFESKKGFLKNSITITSLARKLSTNTKYLSKIVNTYKGKTFITYINDLRIEFILKELKVNSTLQRYTMMGIAEEAGFNSADSFSTAFKKKTGISPSYYIKKIKNIEKEEMML